MTPCSTAGRWLRDFLPAEPEWWYERQKGSRRVRQGWRLLGGIEPPYIEICPAGHAHLVSASLLLFSSPAIVFPALHVVVGDDFKLDRLRQVEWGPAVCRPSQGSLRLIGIRCSDCLGRYGAFVSAREDKNPPRDRIG